MKLVIAYIKSHKLPEVTMALRQIKGLTAPRYPMRVALADNDLTNQPKQEIMFQ